jgi:hypothetical protein
LIFASKDWRSWHTPTRTAQKKSCAKDGRRYIAQLKSPATKILISLALERRGRWRSKEPMSTTAFLGKRQLDWEYGFNSFMYYGEDQWEISLKQNKDITITHIDDQALKEPVVANTGKSGEEWSGSCRRQENPPIVDLSIGLRRAEAAKDRKAATVLRREIKRLRR